MTVTPSRYPPKSQPERRHTSDTGPFVVIPVWVLDLPISHLALRLYAAHVDYADRSGAHYHGRKALAERLGCSVQAIDDGHKALVAHRALEIQARRDAAGDPASNLYVIRRTRPGVAKQETLPSQAGAATGSQAGDATGSQAGDARTRSTASRSLNQNAGGRATDVDGAPVEEPTPPPSLTLPPFSERQRELNLARVRQIRDRNPHAIPSDSEAQDRPESTGSASENGPEPRDTP